MPVSAVSSFVCRFENSMFFGPKFYAGRFGLRKYYGRLPITFTNTTQNCLGPIMGGRDGGEENG